MPLPTKLCVFGIALACDQALAVNSVQRGVSARHGAGPELNGTSAQGHKNYSRVPAHAGSGAHAAAAEAAGAAAEALAVNSVQRGVFARHRAGPELNGTSVQGHKNYSRVHAHAGSGAHAADSFAAQTAGAHAAGAGSSDEVSLSPPAGHSKQWYKDQCTEIKLDCEDRQEEVEKAQAAKVRRLEKRYKRRAEVAGDLDEQAEDAEEAHSKQEAAVKEAGAKVKEAQDTFERTKHCAEKLDKLEEELEELEAEPNDSVEDIEEECQKRKDIFATQQCVDEHIEVQGTFTRRNLAHSDEKEKLAEGRNAAKQAEQAGHPHEARADEAKGDLDKARKEGAHRKLQKIDTECKSEMDHLETLADEEVAAAEAEYRKQQRMQDGQEQAQDDFAADAKDQKKQVKEEKKKVEDARKVYDKLKDCKAELRKAEQELERLEALPDEIPEDIDAECRMKKLILQKQRCTKKAREAKDVLDQSETRHSAEQRKLQRDQKQAKKAGAAAEDHANGANEAEEAVKAAKAARRALHDCVEGEE